MLVKSVIGFISGRRGSWATLLIGLFFAGLAFGPLAGPASDAAPGVGLPSNNETVLVNEALKKLPGADSTAAIIVFKADSTFSESQKTWLLGTPDAKTHMPVGGVADKFVGFTNLQVMGKAFVPPATISTDNTTAIVTVPLAKSDAVKVVGDRVKALRAAAKDGLPSGVSAYVTGPEGFQADLANVFAGADFKLLATTAMVVILLLLITYRSPSLWLIPLLVVGTVDGMSSGLVKNLAHQIGIPLDGSITGLSLIHI